MGEGGPRIEWRRPGDLPTATRNPRKHDLTGIKRSIARLGFRDPVGLDDRTGLTAEGHGRVLAVAELEAEGVDRPRYVREDDDGHWLIPVLRGTESEDDDEATAYLVAHNKLTERAKWDLPALDDMVRDLPAELALVASHVPDDMPEAVEAVDQSTNLDGGEQYVVVITTTEEEQAEVLAECRARGWKCRALI